MKKDIDNFLYQKIWDVKKSLRVTDYVECKKSGTALFFTCPECGKDNCATSQEKPHLYNCFSCGKGGDVLTLISYRTGEPPFRIALKKAYEYGIITEQEYKDCGGDKEFVKRVKPHKPAPKKEEPQSPDVPLADIHILNAVYSALIEQDAFRLTDGAKKYLASRDEEEVMKGEFFCYHKQLDYKKLVDDIKSRLPEFKPSDLAGVPGFYMEYTDASKKEGIWKFNDPQPANLGLVVRDGGYRIRGLQMRISSKKWTGPRYIWVSSAPKNLPPKEGQPVTGMGCSPGSPCHVQFPWKTGINNSEVLITEGIFKARRLSDSFQALSISLQGVTNYSSLPKTIADALLSGDYRSLRREGVKGSYSFAFAFDSDMISKVQVYRSCKEAFLLMKEQFPTKDSFFYLWPMHLGKGIDDLMLANPTDWVSKVYKIKGEDFIHIMDDVYDKVLNTEPFIGKSMQAILRDTELYRSLQKTVYQSFWVALINLKK